MVRCVAGKILRCDRRSTVASCIFHTSTAHSLKHIDNVFDIGFDPILLDRIPTRRIINFEIRSDNSRARFPTIAFPHEFRASNKREREDMRNATSHRTVICISTPLVISLVASSAVKRGASQNFLIQRMPKSAGKSPKLD